MTAPPPVASRPVIAAMLGSLGLVTAQAQVPMPAPIEIRPEAARPPAPAAAPVNRDTLKERDKELEAIRAEHRRTLENEAKLKREIESIGDDRRKLNQQLIDTAARVRQRRGPDRQDPGAPQGARRAARGRLRKSLEQRHAVIAEVLAALQRIGRQAPPAILLKAEDALQAVRSAMMLGAVLPEMRHEAESLAADLAELVRLRKQIAGSATCWAATCW